MRALFAGLAALVLCGGAALAGDLPRPEGPVVLTVVGAIEASNRGPFDEFDDAFLKTLDVQFERAAAFDRAMLERLGTTSITVGHEHWPGRYRFTGPLLRDVLAATGATGQTVRVYALDGYEAEIAVADLKAFPVVLALRRDGRPLAIGGHGPSWVMFPHDDHPELRKRDDTQDVWAVVLIEVD